MQALSGRLERRDGGALVVLAYASVVVLQLKTIWGLWWWRDLPGMDTAFYYAKAMAWAHGGASVTFDTSPAYVLWLAAIEPLFDGPIALVHGQRVLVLLLNAVLVLAFLRRVMPPWPAWWMAAWWAVLPANHDVRYAVHLHGLTPVLVSLLLLARGTRGARAAGFAVMLVGALVMRTELILTAGILLAVLVGAAFRNRRRGASVRAEAAALSVALGAAVAAAALVLVLTRQPIHELPGEFRTKARGNASVMFAVGRSQREPALAWNPYSEFDRYVEPVFGTRALTFFEMAERNPDALLEHLAWNAALIPAGLQRLLFGRWDGRHAPDFDPTRNRRSGPYLLLALLGLGVAGLHGARRRRAPLLRYLRRKGAWGWIAMACTVPGTVAVALTQRPATAYMLSFAVVVLACTGMSLRLAVDAVHRRAGFRRGLWLAALALIVLLPSSYEPGSAVPNRLMYRLLDAHASQVRTAGREFLVGEGFQEVLPYVRHVYGLPTGYAVLGDTRESGAVPAQLDAAGIRLLASDPHLERRLGPAFSAWLDEVRSGSASGRWIVLEEAEGVHGRYLLLHRP